MTATSPTEAEVRALRDLVFDSRSTDESWLACCHAGDKGEGWLHPDNVQWLREHANHLPYAVGEKARNGYVRPQC